jgi:hypothetical protein
MDRRVRVRIREHGAAACFDLERYRFSLNRAHGEPPCARRLGSDIGSGMRLAAFLAAMPLPTAPPFVYVARVPAKHVALALYLFGNYLLAGYFGLRAEASDVQLTWFFCAIVAALLALLGQAWLWRSGSLGGAWLVLLPGIVVTVLFSAGWRLDMSTAATKHSLVTGMVLDRACRAGGPRESDKRLGTLMQHLRVIAVVGFGGWVMVQNVAGHFRRPYSVVLTAYLGLGVLWWLLEELFDPPQALIRRLKRFLARHPRVEHNDGPQAQLRAGNFDGVAAALAEASRGDTGNREAEALELLTLLRRDAAMRGARAIVGECIEAQRRLRPRGLARLLEESDNASVLERVLLAREILMHASTEEVPAARWVSRVAWKLAGDAPAKVSRLVAHIDGTLHDVVKHGLIRIDAERLQAKSLVTGQALVPAARMRIDRFLDELLDRLRTLDARLRPAGAVGLLAEEIEQVTALREAPAWTRTEARAPSRSLRVAPRSA